MAKDIKMQTGKIERSNAETGPWGATLDKARAYDPQWVEASFKMSTNPWTSGILPLKFVELISVAINAACTNINLDGTRFHIRAALMAGATHEEVLMVLKMASLLAIHSCSLGAPILIEEAKAAGVKLPDHANKHQTPFCDKMKTIGQWNKAWDPFYELDPVWTDQFFAVGTDIYAAEVFSSKDVELLSIAFDAAVTHMYAPGTRRHIKGALAAGAAAEEIMEVLKICVAQGVQAFSLGLEILDNEMANMGSGRNVRQKKLEEMGRGAQR